MDKKEAGVINRKWALKPKSVSQTLRSMERNESFRVTLAWSCEMGEKKLRERERGGDGVRQREGGRGK